MAHDPLAQLRVWMDDAAAAGIEEPTAAALATAAADGRPSLRFVLVRGVDEQGVRFYTNYESRKARALAANPFGALTFYWASLQRQVRLEGPVERLAPEQSDAYFAPPARQPDRRLGLAPVAGARVARGAATRASPRWRPAFPPTTSRARSSGAATCCAPSSSSSGPAGPSRLHDREEWRRGDGGWSVRRLSP